MASIIPQAVEATPVAHARVQPIAVLLLPVTAPLKSCVRFVITLAMVGDMVIVTVLEALLPHPKAPSAAARVSIEENFHHLIPVLPRFLNIRPRSLSSSAWLPSAHSIFKSHILISCP